MHTINSTRWEKHPGRSCRLATLKSGPRCLNDEMSENFADAILENCQEWAREASVTEIDFTYGVLYGTKKQSNKKDWHILRNLNDKKKVAIKTPPAKRWDCKVQKESRHCKRRDPNWVGLGGNTWVGSIVSLKYSPR